MTLNNLSNRQQSKPARVVYSLMTMWGGSGGGVGTLLALLITAPFYDNLSSRSLFVIFIGIALATSAVLRGLAIYYGFDTRKWQQILRTFVIETAVLLVFIAVLYKANIFSGIG